MTPPPPLALLLELTKKLDQGLRLEALLREVAKTTLEVAGGDHASVRVFDDSGENLLCGARAGSGLDQVPVEFQRGRGVIGWVARADQSARIDNVLADERFEERPDQGFSIRSMLAVPLRGAESVLGVLAATADKPSAFTAEHELTAQLLANCVVPPLERARLESLADQGNHPKPYNRVHLTRRLLDEIRRARRYVTPVSTVLMDLDLFRHVNDKHGRAVGDAVLSAVAQRVRREVRGVDSIVRRSGDQFLLIMPQTADKQAQVVAERIRDAIASEPFTVPGQAPLHLTVSMGVTAWSGYEGPRDLEGRAEAAMREAKAEGKDRVVLKSAAEPARPGFGGS